MVDDRAAPDMVAQIVLDAVAGRDQTSSSRDARAVGDQPRDVDVDPLRFLGRPTENGAKSL